MKKTALSPVNSTRLINHGPVVMVTSGADKPNIFTVAWNYSRSQGRKQPPLSPFARKS